MQLNATSGLTASRMRFGLGAQRAFFTKLGEMAQFHRSQNQILDLSAHRSQVPPKNFGDHLHNWLA